MSIRDTVNHFYDRGMLLARNGVVTPGLFHGTGLYNNGVNRYAQGSAIGGILNGAVNGGVGGALGGYGSDIYGGSLNNGLRYNAGANRGGNGSSFYTNGAGSFFNGLSEGVRDLFGYGEAIERFTGFLGNVFGWGLPVSSFTQNPTVVTNGNNYGNQNAYVDDQWAASVAQNASRGGGYNASMIRMHPAQRAMMAQQNASTTYEPTGVNSGNIKQWAALRNLLQDLGYTNPDQIMVEDSRNGQIHLKFDNQAQRNSFRSKIAAKDEHLNILKGMDPSAGTQKSSQAADDLSGRFGDTRGVISDLKDMLEDLQEEQEKLVTTFKKDRDDALAEAKGEVRGNVYGATDLFKSINIGKPSAEALKAAEKVLESTEDAHKDFKKLNGIIDDVEKDTALTAKQANALNDFKKQLNSLTSPVIIAGFTDATKDFDKTTKFNETVLNEIKEAAEGKLKELNNNKKQAENVFDKLKDFDDQLKKVNNIKDDASNLAKDSQKSIKLIGSKIDDEINQLDDTTAKGRAEKAKLKDLKTAIKALYGNNAADLDLKDIVDQLKAWDKTWGTDDTIHTEIGKKFTDSKLDEMIDSLEY